MNECMYYVYMGFPQMRHFNECMYVCMCVYIWMYACVCIHVYMHVCMYVCTACMYVLHVCIRYLREFPFLFAMTSKERPELGYNMAE